MGSGDLKFPDLFELDGFLGFGDTKEGSLLGFLGRGETRPAAVPGAAGNDSPCPSPSDSLLFLELALGLLIFSGFSVTLSPAC